jgi:hypothetical protein
MDRRCWCSRSRRLLAAAAWGAVNAPPPPPPPYESFHWNSSSESTSMSSTASSTPGPPDHAELELVSSSYPPSNVRRITTKKHMKLNQSDSHKACGNTLFTTRHYLAAIEAYTLALSLLPETYLTRAAVLHSNIAACHLHLFNPESALHHSTLALQLRPNWSRAMIRQMKALEALGGWKELEGVVEQAKGLLDGSVEVEGGLTEKERREVEGIVKRGEMGCAESAKREVGEVCGKLRELGDGLLGAFGMSTKDFGVRDQGGGKYSMTFGRGEKSG